MTDIDIKLPSRLKLKGSPKIKASFVSIFNSPGRMALVYLVALTVAEAMTTLIEPRVGMVMHGLVLVVLFLHASLWAKSTYRRFLLCMTLAPLIRLLSLSLPLPNFPFIYWYMVVGVPLFIAAFVTARVGKMNLGMLNLTTHAWPLQILVALIGVGIGYAEYLILRPAPLIPEFSLAQVWVPALILLIFTGFLEELIFRGILQYAAISSLGKAGIIYVAVVFAVLHLGYRSVVDVVFVFVVALVFGWITLHTKSIFGVSLAHGLTNIGLYLVFPFIVAARLVTPGTVVPTPPIFAPGLVAPVPTVETTRQWLPPTATPFDLPNSTPSIISSTRTVEPSVTSTLTHTPTLHPTGTAVSPSVSSTATPCTPPGGWIPYTIQQGDTLYALSAKAGISVQTLMQANCLRTDLIISGQIIYLPVSLVTPTPPAATSTSVPTNASYPTSTPSKTSTLTPVPSDTITPTPTPTQTQVTETPTPTQTSTATETFTANPPTPTPTDTLTALAVH